MTPAEIKLLEAAKARIEQRREYAQHEALRARGVRPDVPLHVFNAATVAARELEQRAKASLAEALKRNATREQRAAAARAAVLALPLQMNAYATARPTRWTKRVQGSLLDTARAVSAALDSGRTGHRALRGNPESYVQQEDLDHLIPDGWGRMFDLDSRRLGRRAGVPGSAIPLLCLLTWCSRVKDPSPRDARQLGAGLQVSLEWLARKLGRATSTVKELLNRLDPHAAYRRELAAVRRANERLRREGKRTRAEPTRPGGTPLVHRYRRLQRYATAPQWKGHTPEPVWVDRAGRPHWWVDLRGVCYVTEQGRRLLIRRASPDQPRRRKDGSLVRAVRLRSVEAMTDLELRLHPERAERLRSRLMPVENSAIESTAPPRRARAAS